VRDHDNAGTGAAERLQRGHAGPDPAVISDLGAVERHVEVGSDQDPLALDVAEAGVLPHPGQRVSPTYVIRSPRRLE
jgi:hypothetical protein